MKASEMISILFPRTALKQRNKIVEIILQKAPLYKIRTNLDLAHFLAQVKVETGSRFEPVREGLRYHHTRLPKVFRYYRINKHEALRDGRNKTHRAKQQTIANKVYANRLGNGSASTNDGYFYRGAGNIQITGKTNFVNTQIRIERYDPNTKIDIINTNDIDTIEGSLVSAFAFWIWKDLNLISKSFDDECVHNITSVINKYTHSYDKRLKMFNKIKHLCY